MKRRTRILLLATLGTLTLGTSSITLADHGRGDYRGHGWGHEKHARWHHQHRYEPNGYIVIQSAPRVVYAPPAYYDGGYYYRAPNYYPRYSYPVSPSFSFGMTIPLD